MSVSPYEEAQVALAQQILALVADGGWRYEESLPGHYRRRRHVLANLVAAGDLEEAASHPDGRRVWRRPTPNP
ncbi:MAG TPA: hypothetical protein VH208_01055 [Myxococcaceae bacterium]|nr:hypothetical protein [Myxococcaceae bacterium]